MSIFMPLEQLFSQKPDLAQPDLAIDPKVGVQIIETLISFLDKYIFPEVAQRMKSQFRTHLQNGNYADITSAIKLAEVLTQQMQTISSDRHLQVFYSYKPLPSLNEQGKPTAPEEQQRKRRYARWQNFGFYKVERLAGNIGYLDLRAFVPPELSGETAIAAMNFLSNTEALIIDLRQNGGGSPDTVALISTYLFDHQLVHLNNLHWREQDANGVYYERVQQYWTLPYVPGQRYLDKDVYVLTSSFSFSAAEEFANNLKQLKRATIVGEVTGGGAHPGDFLLLSDHFDVFIPTGRSVNPITQRNWEGTGVEPDIKVPGEQALKMAHLAALKELLTKTTEPEFISELQQAMLQQGATQRVIATLEQD
ncbi:peptidase [Brasilonema octagenarum UFV-E1]|uniref:Peptidase n=3 Tax=Brasilonema TaxID=383614 RepID=A0A856MFZ7_9CYAN|nr:S41 family peptidase [Brasilonema sennae]NMF63212.1 peptidase [Brasilonema octagenarum UFV-OR1]QDL09160.1 peptidase [Brasilonema sennae CENA114]QDL15517.1 peptidase [Brasilonema octagenarum UFV-E1]